MNRQCFLPLLLYGVALFVMGCLKPEDVRSCKGESAVSLEGGVCLIMEHPGLSPTQKATVERNISAGLQRIQALMPIENLRIRVVDRPALVIPEIGLGGYNPNQEEVIIAINTNFAQIDEALERELLPQLAHEIHHARRRRAVGYGSSLLEAMISEGLADHFSMEVAGIDPPLWAVALTGEELQHWTERASEAWNERPYDHNKWFFGAGGEVPRWAGYAIGFELVKNYLAAHPSRKPSTLFDEPATSFQP